MVAEVSPNWETRQNLPPRRSDEGPHDCYPAAEGFPSAWRSGARLIIFEIVTVRGERYRALIDPSREYSAEGLRWEALLGNDTYRIFEEHAVACWRRKPGQ